MIQDTHYWAFQTRIFVIAGLPGTPLWLVFLYTDNPTIARINTVFPHAGWLIPGLVAMQMSLCPDSSELQTPTSRLEDTIPKSSTASWTSTPLLASLKNRKKINKKNPRNIF
ncbi:hypothetical protein K490DRAFT_62702 [Saccharata proteae CBS 121410]|uniref:Uncharacterized protein n=1 Tax=Saccharata proteae CBS 121410 TaxID=1314787 RepID=A0A9P4HVC4_9PEZI|nr:hypothetical protein K490DRAFT_62702 [Saccharata proteae CBS 121410]